MLPDLLKGIDLKALIDDAAWRRFIWDGVTKYWMQSHNLTHLNQILAASVALNRYRDTARILVNIAAHALNPKAGLFIKGPNKKLKAKLVAHWHKSLTLLIGDRPAEAAPSPSTTTSEPPAIIKRIPAMNITDTVNLWKNCVNILAKESQRYRWPQSRLIIDAIHNEWHRRNAVILKDDDYFRWPDIDAVGGNGTLAANWLKNGLLSYMDYHVGNTQGVVTGKRRKILTEVFYGPVPPLFPRYYLEQWGAPSSAHRLRKLAETLASLIRNAKRRRDSDCYAKAIDQWTDDLEYLYLDYYIDKFHFAWPATID